MGSFYFVHKNTNQPYQAFPIINADRKRMLHRPLHRQLHRLLHRLFHRPLHNLLDHPLNCISKNPLVEKRDEIIVI